jgi:hypothetical protein
MERWEVFGARGKTKKSCRKNGDLPNFARETHFMAAPVIAKSLFYLFPAHGTVLWGADGLLPD